MIKTDKLLDVPSYSKHLSRKLKFAKSDEFQVELRQRVEEFFSQRGLPERDCPQMYLKTFILLIVFVFSYSFLVFVAQTWWQALILSIILGLVMAGIGFNIQHDGNHQSYSKHTWINKLTGMSLDLMGGSSYNWHWKHGIFHHTYVNIVGHDNDLNVGVFGRLTPEQPHYSFHRWQHYYLWLLYGLMAIKWQLYDDFEAVLTGKMGENYYPRPKGWDLVIFLTGKILFLTLAFIIPLYNHSILVVLTFYIITTFVLGIVLSIVFQLAHAVEEAGFPLPLEGTKEIAQTWAVHQTETTVNFCRNNPLITWFVGGLNFQVEHHLFPKICHVHYPAIAIIVEETCQEFGVKYLVHSSLWAGLVSHYRWLRQMGTYSSL